MPALAPAEVQQRAGGEPGRQPRFFNLRLAGGFGYLLNSIVRRSAASTRPYFLSSQLRSLLAAALLAGGPVFSFGEAPPNLNELRTRAEAGDADALNALGNAYANGSGVAQDFGAAIRNYTQAAVHGHASAQYNLGMLAELGRGMTADAGAAFRV